MVNLFINLEEEVSESLSVTCEGKIGVKDTSIRKISELEKKT